MLSSYTDKKIMYNNREYDVFCNGKYETLKFFIHAIVKEYGWKPADTKVVYVDGDAIY